MNKEFIYNLIAPKIYILHCYHHNIINSIVDPISSTKDKKNKLLKRNSASGSVMKLKAKKKKGTNIFGLKGVSHSIKKPSKLISHPKLKVSIYCGCFQYL